MTQRKRRIPKIWQTASDNIRYASIDKLEEKIPQGVSFTLVHIMDELMGVSKEKFISIHAFKLQKEIQICNWIWVSSGVVHI